MTKTKDSWLVRLSQMDLWLVVGVFGTVLLIPPIKLRDNLQIGVNEYRFLLKGNAVATGNLMPGYSLAMNATNSRVTLKGIPTTEPVFQLPATWITEVERKSAEIAGYTVVDASSVLVIWWKVSRR